MASADGRWVLVFNGEIYNFRELRAELTATGVRFRSDTDTEVVLHALTRWGRSALARFNGMFALALYDARERSVLLARDPMGIKPLYWLDHRGGLVFSSQYDAVVRHPWCERQRLRPDVAALFLRLGYVPSPYGIVERTGQVPAGSLVSWTPQAGMRSESYAPWPDPPERYLDVGAAQIGVHRALHTAVAHQLVADVPVGAFLSGGIDSPLVTAVSCHELGRSIPAFTIGSDDPAFDEAGQAARYGRHLGVDHTIRTFTATDALDLVDDVHDAFGEPFGDYSAFPTMLVSRLARERVTVALSGDGGDELFFGYPRMWTPLRWRRLMALPLSVRKGLRKTLRRMPEWRPPGAATLGSLGDWYSNIHSEMGGALLHEIAPGLGDTPDDFGLYELDAVPSRPDLAEWLRKAEVSGHLEKMLIKVDRASMHESLEVRVPLLDEEVVAASRRIDPMACMAPGLGKVPLRTELSRYVPSEIIHAPKQGFGVPLGTWLRGPLLERLTERVVEHPTLFAEAFDRTAVRSMVARHCAGEDRTQALWNLLSLQEWAGRHLRPTP